MPLNVTEHVPRTVCRPDLIQRLKDEGFDTDGSNAQLEAIVLKKGYNLPSEHEELGTTYYGFRHEKYIRMYLCYVDSVAEEILFLREMEMI